MHMPHTNEKKPKQLVIIECCKEKEEKRNCKMLITPFALPCIIYGITMRIYNF